MTQPKAVRQRTSLALVKPGLDHSNRGQGRAGRRDGTDTYLSREDNVITLAFRGANGARVTIAAKRGAAEALHALLGATLKDDQDTEIDGVRLALDLEVSPPKESSTCADE